MNYHEILGVPYGATKDEIKRAFHKLAHLHHPDKQGGNAEKFKQISNAYSQLSKTAPETRTEAPPYQPPRRTYTDVRSDFSRYTYGKPFEDMSAFTDRFNKAMEDLQRQQAEADKKFTDIHDMMRDAAKQRPFGSDYTM